MSTSTKKSKLGQFYTTNYEYILQAFVIPDNIPIIEPFAGNGDLLKIVNPGRAIECYDIDPKKEFIIRRDTLLDPPSFHQKYVLTNPPYLAKNKSTNKEIYDLYGCDDLYKCFIELLTRNICEGGIMIVPLNFISSIRVGDIQLRKRFVSVYNIIRINIFEETVFDDTTYTVCSIQFHKKPHDPHSNVVGDIISTVYPAKKQLPFMLNESNNYTIGGEIYSLPQSTVYKIERATKLTKNAECITNILAKCIDDSIQRKIHLSITNDAGRYIDNTANLSERSYATLVITTALNIEQQMVLAERTNRLLEEYRARYNSLFLSNYRESNSIARKRISFGLIFQLCGHVLLEMFS